MTRTISTFPASSFCHAKLGAEHWKKNLSLQLSTCLHGSWRIITPYSLYTSTVSHNVSVRVQSLEVLPSGQEEWGKPQVEAGLHDHLTCAIDLPQANPAQESLLYILMSQCDRVTNYPPAPSKESKKSALECLWSSRSAAGREQRAESPEAVWGGSRLAATTTTTTRNKQKLRPRIIIDPYFVSTQW